MKTITFHYYVFKHMFKTEMEILIQEYCEKFKLVLMSEVTYVYNYLPHPTLGNYRYQFTFKARDLTPDDIFREQLESFISRL